MLHVKFVYDCSAVHALVSNKGHICMQGSNDTHTPHPLICGDEQATLRITQPTTHACSCPRCFTTCKQQKLSTVQIAVADLTAGNIINGNLRAERVGGLAGNVGCAKADVQPFEDPGEN